MEGCKEEWLKARIRKRDKDIREEIARRNLTFGEMADIVREGVRKVFFSEVDNNKSESNEAIFASLYEKDPGVPENVEALVDILICF